MRLSDVAYILKSFNNWLSPSRFLYHILRVRWPRTATIYRMVPLSVTLTDL